MLIRPSGSSANASGLGCGNEDENLVFVDHDIQTGWDTVDDSEEHSGAEDVDAGELIVPPGPEVGDDEISDTISPKNSSPAEDERVNENTGNLSVPSTVSSNIPSIYPDPFLNVQNDLSTRDDVSELEGSTSEPQQQSRSNHQEVGVGVSIKNALNGSNNRHVLLYVLLASAFSLISVGCLLRERNNWRETTIRLEETVRGLQVETSNKIRLEHEKLKAQEEVALREQLALAAKLQEDLMQLKKEAEARELEKQKAEELEREVRRLKEEASARDKEGEIVRELEKKVILLQKEAKEREKEKERASKLEAEVKRLEKEVTARARDFQASGSCKADQSGDNEANDEKFFSNDSESGGNCWLQSEVKMELGECGRKAKENVGKKLKNWGETLSKAQERVKQQMAQDYVDLKEIFTFDGERDEKPKSKTSQGRKSSDKNNDSISKLWNDLGETLSKAQERVMNQMAHDYNDLKDWYQDFSSGSTFRSENENTEKPQAREQEEKGKENKTSDGVKQQDKSEKHERFAQVKGAAKTVAWSVAFASLATVAVDMAGSMFAPLQDNDE